MKIIVVDDNLEEALRLKDYVQDAFSVATVLPETGSETETFQNWSAVNSYIRAINDEFAVLFLDLALSTADVDYNDVRRGLDHGVTIRSLKPHWVLIAYTRFADFPTDIPSYRQAFDGILPKGKLDAIIGNAKRVSLVKRTVNNAIGKRKRTAKMDLPLEARIVDSFGIRTFQAAFGDAAISEIIENEAAEWTEREVYALTTGHSGAFMLALRGKSASGGRHSLVVKVAQNEEVIQHEINAQGFYYDRLGPLNTHLGYRHPETKDLLSCLGVYYCQALVDGQQLLELLSGNSWKDNRPRLEPLIGLLLDVYTLAEASDCPIVEARDLFRLTPTDIGRLETSLEFIVDLGSTLQGRELWPVDEAPSVIASRVLELVRTWTDNDLLGVGLRTAVQHGDLNPGNVLISANGEATLIDLARLGPWHLGYDLSRLALMLRLRLIDAAGRLDWLPERLHEWATERVASFDEAVNPDERLCPEGAFCDQQFRSYLDAQAPDERRNIAYGYTLGTLWDLIKVISYQDLSPYKRIWALIESSRLRSRLTLEIPDQQNH